MTDTERQLIALCRKLIGEWVPFDTEAPGPDRCEWVTQIRSEIDRLERDAQTRHTVTKECPNCGKVSVLREFVTFSAVSATIEHLNSWWACGCGFTEFIKARQRKSEWVSRWEKANDDA